MGPLPSWWEWVLDAHFLHRAYGHGGFWLFEEAGVNVCIYANQLPGSQRVAEVPGGRKWWTPFLLAPSLVGYTRWLMGVQLGCIFVGFYVFSKRSDTSSCQILTKQPERFMGCRFHIVVYLVVWWGLAFPISPFHPLQIRHFTMIHLEIQVLSQHKTRIILWYPMLVGYSIGIHRYTNLFHRLLSIPSLWSSGFELHTWPCSEAQRHCSEVKLRRNGEIWDHVDYPLVTWQWNIDRCIYPLVYILYIQENHQ